MYYVVPEVRYACILSTVFICSCIKYVCHAQ